MDMNNGSETVDVSSMSNDAISKCLRQQFLFDCGPITQSTRSVYVKKLSKLMEERSQQLKDNDNHSAVTNNDHNDEEDSDTTTHSTRKLRLSSFRNSPQRKSNVNGDSMTVKTNSVTTKKRRQTIAQLSSTPKTLSPKALSSSARKSMSSPVTRTTTTAAITHQLESNSLSNYSSESSENDDQMEEVFVRKSPRRKQTPPPRPLHDKTLPRVPSARAYPTLSPSAATLSSTPFSSASKSSPFGSLTRPPLRRTPLPSVQLTSSTHNRLANYSDSEADTEVEQTSDKTIRERLLRHRPINVNAITTQALNTPSQTTAAYDETNYSTNNYNWISYAIVVIVVLFFVFIFSFYLYSRLYSFPNQSSFDLTGFQFVDDELKAPICHMDDSNRANPFDSRYDNSDHNCLKYKSDVMPALSIVKEIKTHIDETLFKYHCGGDKNLAQIDPKQYKIDDIKNAIKNRCHIYKSDRAQFTADDEDWFVYKNDFGNALKLIQLNPNWQLVCTKEDNLMDELKRISISDDYPINLPFGCRLMVRVKQLLWQICASLGVVILSFGIFWYIKKNRRLANEEQDLVYDFVEKSLELLQSPDNPQSMPVLHIRDTLLSASERKSSKYKRIWNKVVKFIESSESRVKVEVGNIDGEDYKAWKWVATNPNVSINDIQLQNNNGSPILRTGGIEWQGQAFGETNVATNQTPNSNNGRVASKTNFEAPTQFLKIRNMFNKETKQADPQTWKLKIRNALLEKITLLSPHGSHGIVHIEIEDESSEGLVYVKCATIAAATDAFNALNGWWCEKKLVSVKFLKAERYYQRFPASANCTSTLTLETTV